MLELTLKLQNNQVTVYSNGKESHQFILLDLSQSNDEWKAFFENPRVYGEKLFDALFKNDSSARLEFDALSKQTGRTIVLVLESPELDGVAWEFAYNKAKEEYVVEDCAFVRALPEVERPANGRMINEVERVPLLFIPANPLVDLSGEPMLPLDEEKEWQKIKGFIEKSNAPFDMIELRPATPEALQSVMARFQNGMIAHFSGHGAATKDGAILLFERENGATYPLVAREFVREIKDKAWIGFLSACQSAVLEHTEFSNLARELAKAGVPFALGMQFNLPDSFTPNISGQFYNYLAHGHAVPEAARQARRAVKRENEFFVGMIALYASHPDGVGKLTWRGVGVQTVSLFRPADVSDLPALASGLIGRQSELMRTGTRLFEGRKPLTVTLHGVGGIGKTALLRHVLLRFAPSFEFTLAIGLDLLPSLERVLRRIEHSLGLPSPCANDAKEREELVSNMLTSKRTLLGLDNFETLNYALNEKDSDEEKTAKSLHSFFKKLAADGVTLCITSREVTNLPGEIIEDIQGLTNENGGRLFQRNVIKQKDKIYIEKIRLISKMVDGHPLALCLLASAFDDQNGMSLSEYIEDLHSYLTIARDKWTEVGRHESLRASFDFTMNILMETEKGKELQTSLTRLSVFRGYFIDVFASRVLEDQYPKSSDESINATSRAMITLNSLWERGLLERTFLLTQEGKYFLYRLHLILRPFAEERLVDVEENKAKYLKTIKNLLELSVDRVNNDPFSAQIVSFAMPDLMACANAGEDLETASIQGLVSSIMFQFGMYDDALKLLKKSYEISKSYNYLNGEFSSLFLEAQINNLRGNFDISKDLFFRSIDIARTLGELESASLALVALAQIHEKLGEYDTALNLLYQALETGQNPQEISILFGIARVYYLQGKFDEALEKYRNILGLIHSNNLLLKNVVIQEMAGIHIEQGDLSKAQLLLVEAFEIQSAFNNQREIGVILGKLSDIELEIKNYDKAINLQESKLSIVTGLDDLREILVSLQSLARIYEAKGEINIAFDLLKKAENINARFGSLEIEAAILGSLGNLLYISDNLDGALRHYEKALSISEQIGDQRIISTQSHNIGSVLLTKNMFREALGFLISALILRHQLGQKIKLQNTIETIGTLYNQVGEINFIGLWKEVVPDNEMLEWLLEELRKIHI